MKKTLGLIVARGGSKGIPKKNLYPVCGVPLIKYTIETSSYANNLSEVILSTDDEEIAKVSSEFGCKVPFLRPKELSEDNSTIIPVIQHAIEFMEQKNNYFDAVMLLQPTNPLRTTSDIDGSVNLLSNGDCDSVISLVKVEDHHPARMKLIDKEGFLLDPPYATEKFDQPRQAFSDVFLRNGAIYLSNVDLIKKKGSLMGDKCKPWLIPRERAVNIDDLFDVFIVEQLLKSDLEGLSQVIRMK
jgi:CMP-N-acetylneuraminic acid synthetase